MWLVWEACSTTSPPISGSLCPSYWLAPSQALHGILVPRFAFLFFSIHFLLMTINSTNYNFFTHCRIIFTHKVQSRLACFQKSGEIWWCAWIEEGAGIRQRSSKVLLYLKSGTPWVLHWFWMQSTASFVIRKVNPVPGLLYSWSPSWLMTTYFIYNSVASPF